MNKTQLVEAVSLKAGVEKKIAAQIVNSVIDVVSETLTAGEKVQLPGFGVFDVTERAARTGKNPSTGEPMEIAASKSVKFKAGKALKNSVNQ